MHTLWDHYVDNEMAIMLKIAQIEIGAFVLLYVHI